MTPSPPDPSLPARLREFHERLPLAGDPPNALLALPDDRILAPRDTPVPAPELPAGEWQELRESLAPQPTLLKGRKKGPGVRGPP
jgi:hypothetical protein